jgi:predicted MPP superfamily phosphohydrolase
VAASVIYVVFFFAYNFAPLKMLVTGHTIHASDPRFFRSWIDGTFAIWLVGSFLGFVLIVFLWIAMQIVCGAAWAFHRLHDPTSHVTIHNLDTATTFSPQRRLLLKQMAIAASATPFAAATYGLLYERLNVEVTHHRIALERLPKAFEGFRIAQLSDFHISTFMTAEEIRRCVAMTNQLKADLIVLTGDYVSWDPAAQAEVVDAVAGLSATHGVLGCLGNHETLTRTEASITHMLVARNIGILRQEHLPIESQGEIINVIGIDDSHQDLEGIERLMVPGTVNILLIHDTFPDSFEHAAKLGIDLTLAGHTHGGQLSLDFLRRGLCLSRFETKYTAGWYERPGGQLHVNRGIGTTMIPIRLGARPEISVLELVRKA